MINCDQCMHYLVCRNTEKAEQAVKAVEKAMNGLIDEPEFDDFDLILTCKHEMHSDDLIAGR